MADNYFKRAIIHLLRWVGKLFAFLLQFHLNYHKLVYKLLLELVTKNMFGRKKK